MALLAPMTADEFRRGIAALILHAAAFNLPCDDEALEVMYRDACGSLPGDLFMGAVRAVLHDWTDSFRLPVPAIVNAKVREDMRLRRVHLATLTAPKPKAKEPDWEPPVDIAAARDEVAKCEHPALRRALSNAIDSIEQRQAARAELPLSQPGLEGEIPY